MDRGLSDDTINVVCGTISSGSVMEDRLGRSDLTISVSMPGLPCDGCLGPQPDYFVCRLKRWQDQDLFLRPSICHGALNFRPSGNLAGDSDEKLSQYRDMAWLGNGGWSPAVSVVMTTVTAK